jgi:Protein of unknown function (DUF3159)
MAPQSVPPLGVGAVAPTDSSPNYAVPAWSSAARPRGRPPRHSTNRQWSTSRSSRLEYAATAHAVAAVITVWRMVRGERLASAVSGLVGVAAAGGVAAWTGSAGGFFLIGIWASFAGALLLLGSLLAGRPLTGLLWNLLHGNKYPWRSDRSSVLAHDVATLTLTVLFGARFVVQQWLYATEATGWLAVAKIGMGTPLLALALLVVFWAFRRSTKRLVTPASH